ncbi:immunity protein YezG family protein [Bacillus pseudomycoides]|uniref:immunity protein YezG family protein n=1 Tax=Bacillus pseudomycoides TaxID=64104 RepID=UPI000BF1BD8D|nr:immunity protein YezG family protein [Bacillus pseudomycoides]PEJ35497.1 TIGR01741 family protein [Bacillus pseudomycoides]PHA80576.1 TIGR01741 family protein [Bacillus pseudomycoides]PHC78579.1 TIGR01741 family protein [Bacillus pseudomycoides]
MNTENLEGIYQKIAIQLNYLIPELWDKVVVYSEVDEYSDSTVFFYYPKNKQEPIYSLDIEDMDGINEKEIDNQLNELDSILRELWEKFKRNKQELWTNLTFELYSTGKFELEFDYTLLAGEHSYNYCERLIIWKYEELGIFPNGDRENDVKLIREYIKKKKER